MRAERQRCGHGTGKVNARFHLQNDVVSQKAHDRAITYENENVASMIRARSQSFGAFGTGPSLKREIEEPEIMGGVTSHAAVTKDQIRSKSRYLSQWIKSLYWLWTVLPIRPDSKSKCL